MSVAHMAESKCSESLHPFIQHTHSPGNIYDKCSNCVFKTWLQGSCTRLTQLLNAKPPRRPRQAPAQRGLVRVWCNRSMQSIHTDVVTLLDQYQIQSCTNEIDLSLRSYGQSAVFFFFWTPARTHFIINLLDSLPEELIRTLAFYVPLEKLYVVYLFKLHTDF